MSRDPPDFLFLPNGISEADSQYFPNNPLLMPLDGSYVQQVLLKFQDTTSYLSNDNSKSFVGTVYGMCSMKEHSQKVQMNTANDLERDSDRNVNPKLTLKSFQRSDAFRTFKPEDVRPSFWCRRTIYYALCYFADCDVIKKPYLMDKNFTFLDIYNFLRDRMRSIWQDLTVQRCTRHRGYIECFEISIRFLIYSNEVLCENEEYDVAQNTLLLNTCLDKLMDGYSDVRSTVNKVTPNESINQMIRNDPNFTLVMNVLTFVSSHEPEFWSYRLLLLIPQLLTPGCSATFCDICQRMPNQIKKSKLVRFSISACLAATSGNIYLYFKLMNSSECHPLQSALMNRFSGCIRVRFLYNLLDKKIVKDSTNPLNFDTLKVLMGYEKEQDEKMLSFLQKYEINTSRNDSYLALETANKEMLAHDDALLAKTAGKTQITSSVVIQKFSGFKYRQLIFDPDFKATFMSSDSQSGVPVHSGFGVTTTTQPSAGLFGSTTTGQGLFDSTTTGTGLVSSILSGTGTGLFGSTTTNLNQVQHTTLATPSDSNYFRSDTFGSSTTTPKFTTTTDNFNIGSGFQLQNTQQNLTVKSFPEYGSNKNLNLVGQDSESNYLSELIKKYGSKKIKIFKPSLNYNAPDLHFKEVSIEHLKPLNDLTKQIMERLLNNNNMDNKKYKEYNNRRNQEEKEGNSKRSDDYKNNEDLEYRDKYNNRYEQTKRNEYNNRYSLLEEPLRYKYGFERFEYDRMPPELEMMKNNNKKNYVYLSINASLYYLEHEFNRYFDSKMSKCILYSLYICSKCTRSKDKSDVLVKKIVKKFKLSKCEVVKMIKKLTQIFKKQKIRKKINKEFRLRDIRKKIKKNINMKIKQVEKKITKELMKIKNMKEKIRLNYNSNNSNNNSTSSSSRSRLRSRSGMDMNMNTRLRRLYNNLLSRNFNSNLYVVKGYLQDQLVNLFYRIKRNIKNRESKRGRVYNNRDQERREEERYKEYNTYERKQEYYNEEYENKDKENKKISVLNSILTSTYDNIKMVVNNTYKNNRSREENKEYKYRDEYEHDTNVWVSGIFVHVNFFDFNTNNVNKFGLEGLGNGLLEFKEHVSDYMNSDYCLNLKLDIFNMCGFRLNKQDLLCNSEKCSKTMFQIMSCELPYYNNDSDDRGNRSNLDNQYDNNRGDREYKMRKQDNYSTYNLVPFSLNVSMNLRSENCLTRVKFVDRFELNTELKDNKSSYMNENRNANMIRNMNISKYMNYFINRDNMNTKWNMNNSNKNKNYVNNDNCVYRSKIGKNDPRYNNQPQIALFACSKTFRLGDDDFLYKMYSSKKSLNVLKFRDKVSVVDSLSLLSYVLNNKSIIITSTTQDNNNNNKYENKEHSENKLSQTTSNTLTKTITRSSESYNSNVCCLVCYRLSVSKLDILTLFRLSEKSDEFRCPHKSPNQVKKRLNTLLSTVNKALMDSLIEQAKGYNLEDAEDMLKNCIRFSCVGFEYEEKEYKEPKEEEEDMDRLDRENKDKGELKKKSDREEENYKNQEYKNKYNKRRKQDYNNRNEDNRDKEYNNKRNNEDKEYKDSNYTEYKEDYNTDINEILVTRLLYPDGLRKGFSEICELMLKGGRLKVLQKPVNLPDLRKFLVDLLMANVSYLEIKRNLQGMLSNTLQRFINNVILNFNENLWELYNNRCKVNIEDSNKRNNENKSGKVERYNENREYDVEISGEYNKNSFIAMLVNLKEHIKATQYTLSSIENSNENKEVDNEMIQEYLYRFFFKVLECFRIERFLVPYSVAYYMENLNLNK